MDNSVQSYQGDLNPEMIQRINQENRDCMVLLAQESKERSYKRCKIYKEEIMMKAWHPSRVERLLEMGYDPEDM